MTRIDFYSLAPDSSGDRFLLTCRLLEPIRARGLRTLIFCPDGEQAQHLDRLLWTYRQDSFVPHGLVGQVDHELTPVLISTRDAHSGGHDVLINLSMDIPEELENFERVCELIDHDPQLRDAGRARFRQYRERGYDLEHHSIRL